MWNETIQCTSIETGERSGDNNYGTGSAATVGAKPLQVRIMLNVLTERMGIRGLERGPGSAFGNASDG
jgi:hypothetical protein